MVVGIKQHKSKVGKRRCDLVHTAFNISLAKRGKRILTGLTLGPTQWAQRKSAVLCSTPLSSKLGLSARWSALYAGMAGAIEFSKRFELATSIVMNASFWMNP